MADNVLITPLSRKIEFFDTANNIDGIIELDASGNLNITAPGGDLNLGDSSTDTYIGDGIANVDIIFEQSGEIRALAGKTLTLGQSDSDVLIVAANATLDALGNLNLDGNLTLGGTVDGIDIATDVAANTAKITNATHTGDVTGATSLTIDLTAITGKTTVPVVSGDFLLISDTSDAGNLKKVDALDFLSSVKYINTIRFNGFQSHMGLNMAQDAVQFLFADGSPDEIELTAGGVTFTFADGVTTDEIEVITV